MVEACTVAVLFSVGDGDGKDSVMTTAANVAVRVGVFVSVGGWLLPRALLAETRLDKSQPITRIATIRISDGNQNRLILLLLTSISLFIPA